MDWKLTQRVGEERREERRGGEGGGGGGEKGREERDAGRGLLNKLLVQPPKIREFPRFSSVWKRV